MRIRREKRNQEPEKFLDQVELVEIEGDVQGGEVRINAEIRNKFGDSRDGLLRNAQKKSVQLEIGGRSRNPSLEKSVRIGDE